MDPFVWDEAKNIENRSKHGVGFEIVYELNWSATIVQSDDRFSDRERRFLAVGRLNGRPYYIAIVPRDGTIRVISARRMHEKEAKRYGI